jgi:nitrate reductase delta subunit
MARTFKVLSALLDYPSVELKAALPELRAVLDAERLLATELRNDIDKLIDELASGDIYDLQERYVLLFDRTRSLSLHLFEHVHGESRDRGQAMIDLKNLYERGGLLAGTAELPYFVPLFLEFLSIQPLEEARDLLGQTTHILAALGERLRKRKSPYESVLRALVAIGEGKPDADAVSKILDETDSDPSDLVALDAAWEEEAVTFGPGAAKSCKDGLVSRIRAALRPAQQMDRGELNA